MDTTRVFLSLGSNLGDRQGNLRAALGQLEKAVTVHAVSSVYETEPMGVRDQPPFLNVAVAGETALSPRNLLTAVKDIEQVVGRRPTFRWGPRVVDIDILLYGDLVLVTSDLTIPHREMRHRPFVLTPLAEIAPAQLDPLSGSTVDQLSQAVGLDGVRRVGTL